MYYHLVSYMFRRLLCHLQRELLTYVVISVRIALNVHKNFLPGDDTVSAETCTRKGDS